VYTDEPLGYLLVPFGMVMPALCDQRPLREC